MPASRPRLRPRKIDECDAETRDLLQTTSGGDGPVLNIFATLAHHPKLLKRWLVFGNHVLFKQTLGARERELLILRTAWSCRAEYEWAQHARIARGLGLAEDEIQRVTQERLDGWQKDDAALLQAADDLHRDQRIGDETWSTLAERYDVQQLMDIVFTVGQYTLVSMALKTLDVQLEDGVEGFPR